MNIVQIPQRRTEEPASGPTARDYIWLTRLIDDFIRLGCELASPEWVISHLEAGASKLRQRKG